jgi:hypothetical protein
MVTDFRASLESGCTGTDCPCLQQFADKTATAQGATSCMRLGDKLADLPAGKSDFVERSLDVLNKAISQGRTFPDYAACIPMGQTYEANRWFWRLETWLGLKPHTLGMLITDRYMVKPRAERGEEAVYVDEQ